MSETANEMRKMEIHLARAKATAKATELVNYMMNEDMDGYELIYALREELISEHFANVSLISFVIDACFIASQKKGKVLGEENLSELTEDFMTELVKHG
jgi:hypothetical protein